MFRRTARAGIQRRVIAFGITVTDLLIRGLDAEDLERLDVRARRLGISRGAGCAPTRARWSRCRSLTWNAWRVIFPISTMTR